MIEHEALAINFTGFLNRISDDEVAAVAFLLAGELFTRGVSGFGALFAASEELRHRARFPQPDAYPIFSGACLPRACDCGVGAWGCSPRAAHRPDCPAK